MHSSSLRRMEDFYRRYLQAGEEEGLPKRRVLDLGSQDLNGSYKSIFPPERWDYTGIDMAAGRNVDIVLKDPYRWEEIAEGSADCVISGQAFEHTEYFWLSMQEIARALRPGGLCCLLAPSGGPEHRFPVDCWRFYPDGMRALARYVQFDCLEAETSWDEPYNDDLGHLYKDTILIARKPV